MKQPWHINQNCWCGRLCGPLITNAAGYGVAFLGVAKKEEQQSYARMIAAAPELLEALKAAEEYFDDRADADHNGERYVPNKEMQILTVIRAAIAKAEGRQ